ncbi:MAG TPA: ABC transporter ATP-binding protein, partial [bacterium]|nr:ABC transporter ATP-binding protein [bacterium]
MSHTFPARRGQPALPVLDDICLEVTSGEILVLLGPSGCGKSTLLNLVAGLLTPTAGSLAFEGAPVGSGQPDTAVVFQDFALFPWRTVRQNVAFGLEMLHLPRDQARERVQRHLELVGLAAFAEHFPHQLSGGMKQRCSMARALAVDPLLLLMDEPLSALDAQTRTLLQGELMRLWQATG